MDRLTSPAECWVASPDGRHDPEPPTEVLSRLDVISRDFEKTGVRPGRAEPIASTALAEAFKRSRAGWAAVAYLETVGRAGHLTPAQADRADHAERRRAGRRRRDPLAPAVGRSRLPRRDDDAGTGRAG